MLWLESGYNVCRMLEFVYFSPDISISHHNQRRNDETKPQVIVDID